MHHTRKNYRPRVRGDGPDSSARRLAVGQPTVKAKYWLARIPFFWSKQNVYLEIEIALSGRLLCVLCGNFAALAVKIIERMMRLRAVRNLPHSSFPC